MKSIRFNRRLADGSMYMLGTACHYPQGWRFIPNVASHKSSRKFHATWEDCLPRWIGYPDHCESEQARDSSKDVLAKALLSGDLDLTVKTIQDALGIQTGDVAGQEFSARDRATYKAIYRADQRAEFIRSWLVAELLDAGHRASEVQPLPMIYPFLNSCGGRGRRRPMLRRSASSSR